MEDLPGQNTPILMTAINTVDQRQTWESAWRGSAYSKQQLRSTKTLHKLRYIRHWLSGRDAGGLKVLDVGCGTGAWIDQLLHDLPGSTFVGVDFSGSALSELASKFSPNIVTPVLHDLESPLALEGKFDLVLAIGIFEHLENPVPLIESIQKLLSSTGQLIVIQSNKRSVFHIERVVRELLGLWNLGFQRDLDSNQLNHLIEPLSFQCKEIVPIPCDEARLVSLIDRFIFSLTKRGRYIAARYVPIGSKPL